MAVMIITIMIVMWGRWLDGVTWSSAPISFSRTRAFNVALLFNKGTRTNSLESLEGRELLFSLSRQTSSQLVRGGSRGD